MSSQALAPAPEILEPSATRFLIDGLNVAYWCGHPPSLRLPITLLSALLRQGHAAQIVLDASAPHRLQHEAEVYRRLRQQAAWSIEVPSGRSADGVLLREARRGGARIVSRDRFADHRRRYRKLIDMPGRLLSGAVADGRLALPGCGIAAALPSTAAEALSQLLDAGIDARG